MGNSIIEHQQQWPDQRGCPGENPVELSPGYIELFKNSDLSLYGVDPDFIKSIDTHGVVEMPEHIYTALVNHPRYKKAEP